MPTSGIVRVKVNHARIVEKLTLVHTYAGKVKHISLERERALFNADANENVTRILAIEIKGDSYDTHYKTIPGRYHFGKKELKFISKKALKLAKRAGTQKLIVVV